MFYFFRNDHQEREQAVADQESTSGSPSSPDPQARSPGANGGSTGSKLASHVSELRSSLLATLSDRITQLTPLGAADALARSEKRSNDLGNGDTAMLMAARALLPEDAVPHGERASQFCRDIVRLLTHVNEHKGSKGWHRQRSGDGERGNLEVFAAMGLVAWHFCDKGRWPTREQRIICEAMLPLLREQLRRYEEPASSVPVRDPKLPGAFFVVESDDPSDPRPFAWTNILAARVAVWGHRMQKLVAKHDVMHKYATSERVLGSKRGNDRERGRLAKEVTDSLARPDSNPMETAVGLIESKLIERIVREYEVGAPVPMLEKGGVSFILYGPPGSGKTHFVETLAKVLDWPLISLSPGNFIHDGVERIEQRATEVFGDLLELDRCVVLFDECDELFRSRTGGVDGRNMLSFATASMLPKLKALNDRRRVIFAMATNYLHHVDDAIRREGRFDMRLLVDRPHAWCRLDAFKRVLSEEDAWWPQRRPWTWPASTSLGEPNWLYDAVASRLALLVPAIRDPARASRRLIESTVYAQCLLRATQGLSYPQVKAETKSLRSGACDPQRLFELGPQAIDERFVCEWLLEQLDRETLWDQVLPGVDRPLAGGSGGKPTDGIRVNLARILQLIVAHWQSEASPVATGEVDPRLQDYLDWIVLRSPEELTAAEVSQAERNRLNAYWRTIPGYDAAMRRALDRRGGE